VGRFDENSNLDALAELIGSNVNGHVKQTASDIGLSKYEPIRITDDTDVTPPDSLISIDGHLVCPKIGILTLSGPPKGGKSGVCSVFVAGSLVENPEDCDGIEGLQIAPNPEKKAVIQFDTEQPKHKQKYDVLTVLKRAGLKKCPDHYLAYNFRELGFDQFRIATEEIISEAYRRFGGVHLVIADGIADYLPDTNDLKESEALYKWLIYLINTYQCCIVAVIHTNPNSDKERGHTGSASHRRSDAVVQIKRDGDISYIDPKYLRFASISDTPKLEFQFDRDKGYHVGIGVRDVTPVDKGNQRILYLSGICSAVFGGQVSLEYDEAITAIMKASSRQIATAKKIFKEIRESDLISQGDDKRWRSVSV